MKTFESREKELHYKLGAVRDIVGKWIDSDELLIRLIMSSIKEVLDE